MLRLFVSSVQKEFVSERTALRDYLRGDPLMRRFVEPFFFEDVPAADRRADQVYLREVAVCDLYLALLGEDYGYEDSEGLSPTQREFDEATRLHKTRLVFVKGADDRGKHPKMRALIGKAGSELIRRRFSTAPELLAAVYAALVQVLEDREILRFSPFDATACRGATLDDLDPDRMAWFLREARRARAFPLSDKASRDELLAHLNLLDAGRPTHAAVLLFGRQPQRFLTSSEVKCAHFHGIEAAKPIPSYQVYKGTVFALVDQAVDFVLSKLNLSVGTRASSSQAPVEYEVPPEVVREAIVNAVAHRDYTSNGSVQVMLFADRMEVWNPGALAPPLTLAKLRLPHGSVPTNPLLAEPLYLAKYVERMGTGIGDMIRRCRAAGLPEPGFAVTDGFVATVWRDARRVSGQAGLRSGTKPGTKLALSGHQVEALRKCMRESSLLELLTVSGRSDRTKYRNQVLAPLLAAGLLEMSVPDKPSSSKQKYRLTKSGLARLDGLGPSPIPIVEGQS